jgi:site-specific DNA-cytosine methylase
MPETNGQLTNPRPESAQRVLSLEEGLACGVALEALDLFSGIGGLSSGFRETGFTMTGVDSEPVAKIVYESAKIGHGVTVDLGIEPYVQMVPVVLGGPPCRPWSAVNQQRRRAAHDDHILFDRFIDNVMAIMPVVALLENVPALGSDPIYASGMARLRAAGYDVDRAIIQYSMFGAATRRKRLFTVAVHSTRVGARRFFELLQQQRRPALTVRDAIHWLRDKQRSEVPDHEWSELQSIGNYRHLYKSGKYGWAKLRYDEAAPSFGSVAKTYILHPEAGDNGFPERVLSVREVLSIQGFDSTTSFPPDTPRAKRYQMAANAVSPQVSRASARAIRELLTGEPSTDVGLAESISVGLR